MGNELIKAFISLLKVRTLVTLSFTWATIFILVKAGTIPAELNTIMSMILGFYFGTKFKEAAQDEIKGL